MSALEVPMGALQRWMLEALVVPGQVDKQAVADLLLPGPQLNAAACLAIYQRSYILRLRRCLAEQFPATCHALGDKLFEDFADAYLRDCPPDSYTLHALGRRFAAWLDQQRPDRDYPEHKREAWIDFMVDLAHYERNLFCLFDAHGHEGLPWAGADADDNELILQPCLQLAQYRYPVAWYYHEVRARRRVELPPRSPSHMVILRRDYLTSTFPVSPLHYRFLASLSRQGRIDHALADIATWTQRPIDAVTRSWATEVRRPWLDAGFFIKRAAD